MTTLFEAVANQPMDQVVALIVGYSIGSIPFAWLIARAKGVNLLKVGSGSSGATNAARAIGWKWFFPIFLLDAAKGFVPVFFAGKTTAELGYSVDPVLFIVAGAILGHTFSPWLRFKGGKAIATGVGAVLALSPATGGIALAVFALMFFTTRFVSLGSICGALSVPVSYAFLGESPHHLDHMVFLSVMAAFVNWKHRTNIVRLLNGTESRAVKRKLALTTCVFHAKAATDSTAKLPPVPHESCH